MILYRSINMSTPSGRIQDESTNRQFFAGRDRAAIQQLSDHRQGHGPKTVITVLHALGIRRLQQGFDSQSDTLQARRNNGDISAPAPLSEGLTSFKAMISSAQKKAQDTGQPERLCIPLGLKGNHMTGLVVDIKSSGEADIAFFNSLGNSDTGSYHDEARPFIDAVREKFPTGETIYSKKRFQQTELGDNYCGDWTIWFLEQAADSSKSLTDIMNKVERTPNIPDPKSLRAENIRALKAHLNTLSQPEMRPEHTTRPATPPVSPTRSAIKRGADSTTTTPALKKPRHSEQPSQPRSDTSSRQKITDADDLRARLIELFNPQITDFASVKDYYTKLLSVLELIMGESPVSLSDIGNKVGKQLFTDAFIQYEKSKQPGAKKLSLMVKGDDQALVDRINKDQAPKIKDKDDAKQFVESILSYSDVVPLDRVEKEHGKELVVEAFMEYTKANSDKTVYIKGKIPAKYEGIIRDEQASQPPEETRSRPGLR